MVAHASIPVNEMARLAALYSFQVLDTPPDERFDLFTRLGAWIFDASICAINLIDSDRTFFKSTVGLAPYRPARCTSLCAHALALGDPLMVVEDLTLDSRFHDHPLTLKGTRFYAGAMLRSDCGFDLGTFCIGDSRPRTLSDEESARLLDLAKGVSGVMELHRAGVVLRRAAMQDPLTGLFNRRAFEEKLEGAAAASAASGGFVLMYLDLDHFKAINDRFGHAGGDAVLREVARRLDGALPAGSVIARLGGDEFTVLVSGISQPQSARALGELVLDAFSLPFFHEGERLPILCSIGLALHPGHATQGADLIRCADLALYEAKQRGRNQARLHAAEPSHRAALPWLAVAPPSRASTG